MIGRGLHRTGAALAILGAALPLPALAQRLDQVQRERTDFLAWLRTAPVSPWRAIVVRPIGTGLTLGPATADIPLRGVPASTVVERNGRSLLQSGTGEIGLGRGRPQAVERYWLVVHGLAGRATLTVYGSAPAKPKPPTYFAYDPRSVFTVRLLPPAEPRTQRLLAPDGVEVEASDAGTAAVTFGRTTATLQVMRLPGATEDESELEIYFRDETAGKGSYPAGRFVSLLPLPDGRYLLDFNRSRNPFCAYNTVYPCPAPWRGNTLSVAVRAGERYVGAAPEVPTP